MSQIEGEQNNAGDLLMLGFIKFIRKTGGQQRLVYITDEGKFCTRGKLGDLPAGDEAITFAVMQKA